jgi:predicted lipoprotein with Yx(FWY)xxD motif
MLCLALSACRGSFGAGLDAEDSGAQPGEDAGAGSGSANGGERDGGDNKDTGDEPEVDASLPDDDAGAIEVDASGFVLQTKFASNEQFDDYLTDQDGRALYFYAGDAAGADKTTCMGDCAAEWPPFDWGKEYNDILVALQKSESPPAGVADYRRFHREDGLWQVTYKNRPLYYYRADEGQALITGDGINKIWFVARNYFVFLRFDPRVSPAALSVQDPGTPYLTDGSGKAIYARIFGTQSSKDVVICADAVCLQEYPEWAPTGDVSKLPIPSALARGDFGSRFRDNGTAQLDYKGYPLHYNFGDEEPGETRGHEVKTWRLIAPSGFPEPAVAP